MADLINTRYQGCSVTIGISGMPITVTGEVCSATDNADTIVTLKMKDGKTVNVAEASIAFFF